MECMGALIALGDKAQDLDKKVEKIEEIIKTSDNEYNLFIFKTLFFF